MRTTKIRRGAAALALLALAGCGSSSYGGGSKNATSSSAASSSATAASGADLSAASSDLGRIVVDSTGRTVYVFDKDTPGSGASACTAACLTKWPPVKATSDEVTVHDVTGKVGVITRDDGTKQLTLGGMPLYLYSGDSHAGDVTGQAVGNVWWVVSPAGTKIAGAAASSSSSAAPPATGY